MNESSSPQPEDTPEENHEEVRKEAGQSDLPPAEDNPLAEDQTEGDQPMEGQVEADSLADEQPETSQPPFFQAKSPPTPSPSSPTRLQPRDAASPLPVDRLQLGRAAAQAWDEALLESRARQTPRVPPSREWFERLPALNRFLLGSGGLCLATGLFCLLGVPLLGAANSSLQTAARPYTAAGKSETCLSNLQRLSAALAQYSQDYDGHLPPGDYQSGGKRHTWVALLRDRGEDANVFTCPAGSTGGDGVATSSYGFNPVLIGQSADSGSSAEGDTKEGENAAAQTILLADRGEAHDTNLLPPFAGWPTVKAALSAKSDVDVEKGNLSANHDASKVAVLFRDGHADTRPIGLWTEDAASWGGPLLFAESLKRLEAQYPVLKQIKSAPAKAFAGQKAKLQAGLDELRVLQGQSQSSGNGHESLDKRLWKGAGVLRALGDGKLEQELTGDLNRQVQSFLKETSGEWQSAAEFEGDDARPFTMRFPSNWRVQTEIEGRYRTTYLRSASPYLEVLVERGERNQPTEARTIDWSGMEANLKKKYGGGYKRLKMGRSVLNGQEVSLWECELKKPDGPKLHKRYLGHSSRWSSTILVTIAPVNEWKAWSPVFEQITDSFEFRE